MPKKTIAPLEVTDTAEIPVVSVDIPTDYEDLTPDPVPATEHIGYGYLTPNLTVPRKYENLLPIVATALASITTGALIITAGVIIGAGL